MPRVCVVSGLSLSQPFLPYALQYCCTTTTANHGPPWQTGSSCIAFSHPARLLPSLYCKAKNHPEKRPSSLIFTLDPPPQPLPLFMLSITPPFPPQNHPFHFHNHSRRQSILRLVASIHLCSSPQGTLPAVFSLTVVASESL